MKPLYIFDLDGTLALIKHRLRYIQREKSEKDWNAFDAACVDDTPNQPVIDTMEHLRDSGSEIWIFSGRSDNVRTQTVEWLVQYTSFMAWELKGPTLTMRPSGDRIADRVLKKQWLDNMGQEDKERLVAVFDDRDSVVAMWRAAGVTCFQVALGDF